ncbi:MAG: hypothetical protein ACXVNR_11580 [Bacteroidia bacterium]
MTDNYTEEYSFWWFAAPGIFFSAYLLLLFRKTLNAKTAAPYFFILFVVYALSFIAGFFSYSLAVPVVGAAGAFAVKRLFKRQGRFYVLIGLLMGLAGLLLFYLTKSTVKLGAGFAIVIDLCQLAIGIKYITESERITSKTDII